MSRWLVTGAGGMLGRAVVAALRDRGEDVIGLNRCELDVTSRAAVQAAVRGGRPDVVVNCAAWTAVDAAESDERGALAVNGTGAGHVAAACAAAGARLVQISTDYVFGGNGTRPYDEHDDPEPSTAYGRTKLAGERAVLAALPDASLVLRTAWLYGGAGPSFVHTIVRLAARQQVIDVVADQHGQPTWTADVARTLVALATADSLAGVYHVTSRGQTTWYELAREVFRLLGTDPDRIRPTTSGAIWRPAPRPRYSVLGHDRLAVAGVEPIGDWRAALGRAWPMLDIAQPSG